MHLAHKDLSAITKFFHKMNSYMQELSSSYSCMLSEPCGLKPWYQYLILTNGF